VRLSSTFWGLGFGSSAVLASALGLQYAFSAPPCPLCLYQRVPYVVVIMLVLLQRVIRPRLLLLLLIMVAAISAVLAGYHVGVEQKLWQYTCASSATNWMTSPPVLCDTLGHYRHRVGAVILCNE
jgi:disulfide bond formation protein DsbB